jgi:hypothetical protein
VGSATSGSRKLATAGSWACGHWASVMGDQPWPFFNAHVQAWLGVWAMARKAAGLWTKGKSDMRFWVCFGSGDGGHLPPSLKG